MLNRFLILSLMIVSLLGVTACDSEPPVLMKASKQFETDEKRDQHISYMRKHHMDALKHKRDETMYQGIRTEQHSIVACINCHVPESHNGKVLRHTDQKHFCTTCHSYVAAQLDCFECHADHPEKSIAINTENVLSTKNLSELSQSELIDLAFMYSAATEVSNYISANNRAKQQSRGAAETALKRSDDDPKGEVFIYE